MIFTKVEYKILMSINDHNNFIYRLSSKIDCTYSHASKTVDKLEALGILESKHAGRKRIITLTPKGIEVRDLLLRIRVILNLGDVSSE